VDTEFEFKSSFNQTENTTTTTTTTTSGLDGTTILPFVETNSTSTNTQPNNISELVIEIDRHSLNSNESQQLETNLKMTIQSNQLRAVDKTKATTTTTTPFISDFTFKTILTLIVIILFLTSIIMFLLFKNR
jgi:hypothetical protein